MIDTDIEFFLAISTLIAGLLILLRRFINQPRPIWLYNAAQSFFPVLLFVLIFRGFIVEPFRIPSGSMIPTLEIGDFIAVNKFTYGIRMPVTHWLIMENNQPQRGDVIVFRFPSNPSQDYIKRLIGLPGDRIRYKDKVLTINGQVIDYSNRTPYHITDFPIGLEYKNEHLNEITHGIIIAPAIHQPPKEWVVPQGHYFVMGDNRDNSNDSRMWGFVPQENLVGKAFIIWMSWNHEKTQVEFSRIGTNIE